ncbi:chemotaxis protein [Paramagnetospirillum marisnigri]|uniref:Chemotaxis protein n=1 Tax=Paramagnetospirillum marisnigri TaxID=1285242 RepID=A0A178MCN0_9PROT|nr:response regulator [Paramagnetospirillum marisnigri]OAN45614.1 chemotaxis protein [Paramagnetospirillum marisnigri]
MSSRAPSGSASPVIVVIEDEAVVLAGYQMLFESWDYPVVAAQSVDEAMAVLEEETSVPGFILADFRLGNGHTGLDAIEALRKAYGRDIPGVLVTGDTTVTVVGLREAVEAGMPVLHKPVNAPQLRELLNRTLGAGKA